MDGRSTPPDVRAPEMSTAVSLLTADESARLPGPGCPTHRRATILKKVCEDLERGVPVKCLFE